jgi:hypothetical protein
MDVALIGVVTAAALCAIAILVGQWLWHLGDQAEREALRRRSKSPSL